MLFDEIADTATIAAYRWLFATVVGSAPGLFALVLLLGELALGALLLTRHRGAWTGVVLSVAWCLFLLFLVWPYTLSTLPLLVLAG